MDWFNWCRLCGNTETMPKVERAVEEIVQQLLFISSPVRICVECIGFLNEINTFRVKTKTIQPMFEELMLLNVENQISDESLKNIRQKFGLESIYNELNDDLRGLFCEVNHPVSVEIKQEEDVIDTKNEKMEVSGDEFNHSDSEDFISDSNESEIDDIDSEESNVEPKPSKSESNVKRIAGRKKFEKTEAEKLFEFICHVCKQEFNKMNLLANHTKSEHDCLPQVSCLCGKLLGTWKRLMTHKQKHLAEKADYECKDCKLVYKTKAAYDKHMETRHGPNSQKFICPTCGKNFKDKQILRNHEKIHLPEDLKLKYPCTHCEKKFINSHCLKIHIARIHDKVTFHTCETCGKGCITKSDLKWHQDKHTTERKYECEICKMKFKSTNSLRIHKKRHFNVDKIVSCEICFKEFRNNSALNNHRLVHSDVKRYKCQYCANEYKRLETYKCHLSTHTGERPFSCQFCDRTFVNSANCRKHKLKDHSMEVEAYEAIHGKKGVSMASVSNNSI